jgi:hypothetical protein
MKENTYIKLKIYISIFGVVFRFAFSGVRVTRSLVLCVCVVDRCLFYCTLFCWPLGNKGVNLIADPGYGKTSIVSQLICAEHSSPWFNFRNDIFTGNKFC